MPVTGAVAALGAICSLLFVAIAAMVAARRKSEEPWLLRAPLLWLVLAVLLGLISIYSLLMLLAFDAPDFKLPATANVSNPVLVAATLVAGGLTAAYAVLRLRAHLVAEEKGKIDARGDSRADDKHRSDLEVALIERFAKGVELLASNHAISRIAGAHLILALGDEWKRGVQRCLDVLVSHLRGLRENHSFDDEAGSSYGVREEVRLITSEVIRRLSELEGRWDVRAGDFRGAVLGDVDLTEVRGLSVLDFREARILGDLTLSRRASDEVPQLAGLTCDGDLSVEWTKSHEQREAELRDEIDLSAAAVGGSIVFSGELLDLDLKCSDLRAGGDFSLAFEEFECDVTLDAANVQGEIRIGSTALSTAFGVNGEQTSLSLADAAFSKLTLRNLSSGPLLNLSGASGEVDLSDSRFSYEVVANHLDASTGLNLRRSKFEAALVLDGATIPAAVDVEGLILSASARSGIQSSDFAFRDRLLGSSEVRPARGLTSDSTFNWRRAMEPIRDGADPSFIEELERRLADAETNLPLDWQQRTTFTSRIMSDVSRAAAKTDQTKDVMRKVQEVLRESLDLASAERESV
ncbi:hypothetical protein [Arthrobacter sp. Alg241-R88]|uniref:hypothetical protein n=1 Tax=Arthrobacter sp. Alg241-R88 TaxID=2305984 RepID=UPI0013D049B8|nr:hypothetical protein [Arthrobacter sp. Alg241-R88]